MLDSSDGLNKKVFARLIHFVSDHPTAYNSKTWMLQLTRWKTSIIERPADVIPDNLNLLAADGD